MSCSAFPQVHRGEETTFIFLYRCFSLLWPVLNRKMITWSCLVRLWYASGVVGVLKMDLMMVLLSARQTGFSGWSSRAPIFASLSARSFPAMPQCEGTHCNTVRRHLRLYSAFSSCGSWLPLYACSTDKASVRKTTWVFWSTLLQMVFAARIRASISAL